MNKLKGIALKKAIAGFVLYNVISIFIFFIALTVDGASNDYLGLLLGVYLGVSALGVLFAFGIWAVLVLHE